MPERQCDRCTRQKEWGCSAVRYPSHKDDPAARPNERGEWWGWINPADMPLTVDGEETYACPRQDVRTRRMSWQRMLLFYGFYKKGHLPQTGAVMDQSNKAMELFRIFDDANYECDKALEEKDAARRRREQEMGAMRRH
jgi:hypothetical protein